MSDVAGWMKRQRRENVESNALFYYRACDGGGVEQVCSMDHQVIVRPITRQQAVQTAQHLLKLALEGWRE